MKERLQSIVSEVTKEKRLPRAVMALGLVTMLTGFELINRFVSAEEMQSNAVCSVGVKIRGIEFVDLGGERGIYDPGIDREVGVAGNFTAIMLASDKVRELGRTRVGPDGIGFIGGINEECNAVGPNNRPALRFWSGTEGSDVFLSTIAEDRFAAKVVIGRQVDAPGSNVPRDRRDRDFDRDTDSDTDSDSNSSSRSDSRSDSRSESSIDLDFPDKIKTEIVNEPLEITGTVGIKGPLEVRVDGLAFNETVRQEDGRVITGTVIGLRPEPPDLGNWRWWPWLIIPAAVAGGLAGLGAFLGGRAGRRDIVMHEGEHHAGGAEGHTHAAGGHTRTERTTRRETRTTEGVAEGTPEGTARATRETRERRETRETT